MVAGYLTLLSGVLVLERIFTPIMGLSILLGLLTYGLRMRTSPVTEEIEVGASA
jgi:hypothetical protein